MVVACHSRESGSPACRVWTPAFAGVTVAGLTFRARDTKPAARGDRAGWGLWLSRAGAEFFRLSAGSALTITQTKLQGANLVITWQ